jgi:hypothetical protein
VFGVYDGDDDRFVFAVQEFDEQEKAELRFNPSNFVAALAHLSPLLVAITTDRITSP